MNPTAVYISRSNHTDLMPQFEDQSCWNCKKPKEVIRILKHWDDPTAPHQYEALMWCVNDSCTWGHKSSNPCKTHMSLNAIDDKPPQPKESKPDLRLLLMPTKPDLRGITL